MLTVKSNNTVISNNKIRVDSRNVSTAVYAEFYVAIFVQLVIHRVQPSKCMLDFSRIVNPFLWNKTKKWHQNNRLALKNIGNILEKEAEPNSHGNQVT